MRGKLFRRGFALLLDYAIVASVCIVGALALNASVAPTVVRMDLDLPFVDYQGDQIAGSPWKTTKREAVEWGQIIVQERIATYDYLGLFQQTYHETRKGGEGSIEFRPAGDKARPDASPASPSAAPPASPASPVSAPDPPPPPAPPSPPTPANPAPPVAPGAVPATGAQSESDAGYNCPEGEDSSINIRFDNGMLDGEGCIVTGRQLVNAATNDPITRPSLDTLSLILLVIYFAVMESGRRRSTIGKDAFNLNVTREDGRPIGFGTALGRNVIKVLSFFILPIAVLVALFSRRRQGIHDRIAGTVVVRHE